MAKIVFLDVKVHTHSFHKIDFFFEGGYQGAAWQTTPNGQKLNHVIFDLGHLQDQHR